MRIRARVLFLVDTPLALLLSRCGTTITVYEEVETMMVQQSGCCKLVASKRFVLNGLQSSGYSKPVVVVSAILFC